MSHNSTNKDNKSVQNFATIDFLEQALSINLAQYNELSHIGLEDKLSSYNECHVFIVVRLINLLALEKIYPLITGSNIKSLMASVSECYSRSMILQVSYDTFLIKTSSASSDYFSEQLRGYFYNSLKKFATEYSYLAIRAGYAKTNHLIHHTSTIKQAYIALYEACHRRIPCFHYEHINETFFAQDKVEDIVLFKELEQIVYDSKIDLIFHPIVSATDYRVHSYEALSRARHYPSIRSSLKLNIAAAERLGYISHFDWLTLGLVVRELLINKDIIINLNVSPISLGDISWVNKAVDIPSDQPIAKRLVIEITETSFHHDFNELTSSINKLKDIGCSIAIDGFGTGYASLGLLKKIPVDFIKIDGSYITQLNHNLPFIECIIYIGEAIKAEIVAEFVEDLETAQKLTELGVHYLQGNYFHQALSRCGDEATILTTPTR